MPTDLLSSIRGAAPRRPAAARLALVLLVGVLLSCVPTTPSSAPFPSPSWAIPTPTGGSTQAAWAALYLHGAEGAPDYDAGPKTLALALASLPGRDLFADRSDWTGPIKWSPSGAHALIAERHGGVYVFDPAGPLRKVADNATSTWGWIGDAAVGTVRQLGGGAGLRNVLEKVELSSSRLSERPVPAGVVMGEFSADGRFLAYTEPGPHSPTPSFLLDVTTLETRTLGLGARPRGWLKDGRLLVLRDEGSTSSAELINPIDLKTARLLSPALDAIASPGSDYVAVVGGTRSIWTFQGGAALERGMDMPEGAALLSISATGDLVSYSQRISRFPSGDRARTGVLLLGFGRVIPACDEGCSELALR